jgi:hypothetical protein
MSICLPYFCKMPNIKLNYQYRDYANYKNHGEAIFTNPDNLSLEQVTKTLQANLLDSEWFYASKWGVKDLHFEKYDDENDHPYHTFVGVALTDEEPTDEVSATVLLERVIKAGNEY